MAISKLEVGKTYKWEEEADDHDYFVVTNVEEDTFNYTYPAWNNGEGHSSEAYYNSDSLEDFVSFETASEVKVGQKYRYEGREWGSWQGTLTTVTSVSGERIDTEPGTWDSRGYFFSTEADLINSGKTMGYVLVEDVEQEDKQLSPNEDAVNHPTHYTSDPSGVECIQITRHRNFNIGNAIKYLWRAGLKKSEGRSEQEKQIEDLKKAVFYIQDEIKRLES